MLISTSLPFQLKHFDSTSPYCLHSLLYPIYSYLWSSLANSFVWPTPLIAASSSGSMTHTHTSALALLWHSLLSTWYSGSIPSLSTQYYSFLQSLSLHSLSWPLFLLHTSITANHHSQGLHCIHLLNDLISNFHLTCTPHCPLLPSSL